MSEHDYDQTFIEELPCKLTDAEERDRGRRAALLHEQHRTLKEELKQQQQDGKRRLGLLEAEHCALLKAVRTGQEVRPVECVQRDNLTTQRREKVRTDTGEVFWSRPLTTEELRQASQEPLPFRFEERTRITKPAPPTPEEVETADQLDSRAHAETRRPMRDSRVEPEHDEDGVVAESEPPPSSAKPIGASAPGNLPQKLAFDEDEPFGDSGDSGDSGDPGDKELFG